MNSSDESAVPRAASAAGESEALRAHSKIPPARDSEVTHTLGLFPPVLIPNLPGIPNESRERVSDNCDSEPGRVGVAATSLRESQVTPSQLLRTATSTLQQHESDLEKTPVVPVTLGAPRPTVHVSSESAKPAHLDAPSVKHCRAGASWPKHSG